MRNTLIISGGVLIGILVLAGLWWYLLLNGRPEGLANIPNPFGDGGKNEFAPEIVVPDLTDEPRTFSTALQRITDTPVAGAAFIEEEGRALIHYAERGTGHLYIADPATGTSTRLSGTTVPRTTEAMWSPAGTHVVLVTETAAMPRTFLGTLEYDAEGDATLDSLELDRSVRNLAFSADGTTLFYTEDTTAGSAGYARTLETGARRVVFSSPLRDLAVSWEPEIIAYTTPSALQDGYAYRSASFNRLFGGVPGLMVTQTSSGIVATYTDADTNTLKSRASSLSGTEIAVPVFPEKCAADGIVLWCGAPTAPPTGSYPDDWYQGAVSFDDIIWQVNTATGNATLVSIPSEDVGVALDVTNMQVSKGGAMLLFIDKNTGALWLQDTF